MKNSLKIALFLILSSTLFAQNIKITVNGLENSMASLYSVGLEKSELIESINSDNSGQFQISANKNRIEITYMICSYYRLALRQIFLALNLGVVMKRKFQQGLTNKLEDIIKVHIKT